MKIGDRVRVIKDYDNAKVGMEGVIVCKAYGHWGVVFDKEFPGGHNLGGLCAAGFGQIVPEEKLEIITNKPIMSNLKEKFLLALKSEPEKSFRKAGITNGDDMLTAEGQELFINFMFNQNKTEFKKEVVDPILAAEKE